MVKKEAEELGIENLKKVITFMVATANAVGKSLEDGNLDVWDVRHFWDPACLAIDSFRNFGAAVAEFDDLSQDEKEEIYDHIDEVFDLEIDDLEPYVEQALKAGVALGDLICDTIDRFKKDA